MVKGRRNKSDLDVVIQQQNRERVFITPDGAHGTKTREHVIGEGVGGVYKR